jgi:hypothetical protein
VWAANFDKTHSIAAICSFGVCVCVCVRVCVCVCGGGGGVLFDVDACSLHPQVFEKIKWTRVVLDEMQEVRSSGTKVAMACRALDAQFRFMVSGTPLYTGIADLHGELSFLRVYPWAQDDKVIFVMRALPFHV